MELKCLHCNQQYVGKINIDSSNWRHKCRNCESESIHSFSEKPIMLAFADEERPEEYTDNFENAIIKDVYLFNNSGELINAWSKVIGEKEGFWYFAFNKDELICSGVCDANDMDIFIDYFNLL